MMKKGAVFNWTRECDNAFKLLKEKLMEEPMLINPQVNKDYVIHCDTCKNSYSGILQQTRPGTDELTPIAYFSGSLRSFGESLHCTTTSRFEDQSFKM